MSHRPSGILMRKQHRDFSQVDLRVLAQLGIKTYHSVIEQFKETQDLGYFSHEVERNLPSGDLFVLQFSFITIALLCSAFTSWT